MYTSKSVLEYGHLEPMLSSSAGLDLYAQFPLLVSRGLIKS